MVVFYGQGNFCRKTAQFSETQRKCDSLGSPMKDILRNIVKNCAKTNQSIIRQLVVFLASSGEGAPAAPAGKRARAWQIAF